MKVIDEQYFRKNLYLELCYDRDWKDLDLNERKILLIETLKSQDFSLDSQIVDRVNIRYLISNKCRYCKQTVSEEHMVETQSYWTPLGFAFVSVCHKDCKDSGYKQEVLDCQKIDADCNDCKHFKRIKMSQGNCLLHSNKEVTASQNHSSLHSCFQHRKEINITTSIGL